MPTRTPEASTTGSRRTCSRAAVWAVCTIDASGRTVTTGELISSAAVSACDLRRMYALVERPPLTRTRGSPPVTTFASRSDSDTMPSTRRSALMTGTALMRFLDSVSTTSLNGVSADTEMTARVITSLTRLLPMFQ